jgi:hypothetical protein
MLKRAFIAHHLCVMMSTLLSLGPIRVARQKLSDRFQIDWIDVRQKLHFYLTEYRWAFIVFLVIPLSFLYDLQYRARSWFVWLLLSAPALHDRRVQHIQQQVAQWNRNGRTKQMVIACGQTKVAVSNH